MRNLLYLVTFFLIAPVTLATSLFALNTVHISGAQAGSPAENQEEPGIIKTPRYGTRVYAAIPDQVGEVAGAATSADARVEVIKQYLEEYKSPLAPHAQELVDASDQYGLEFRLLPAIAQQESNLCKKIPDESYNCWGWGIHSKGTLRFTNYSDAIEAVAKGLREDYFDKGYTTLEEIMSKYTPLSPGTWASGVQQFIDEME